MREVKRGGMGEKGKGRGSEKGKEVGRDEKMEGGEKGQRRMKGKVERRRGVGTRNEGEGRQGGV